MLRRSRVMAALALVVSFAAITSLLALQQKAQAQGRSVAEDIQHPGGGLRKSVSSKVGWHVDKGNPDPQCEVQRDFLIAQGDILRRIETRLVAESEDQPFLPVKKQISSHLEGIGDRRALETEMLLLEENYQTYLVQMEALDETVHDLNEMTKIVKEQLEYTKEQVDLVRKEQEDITGLYEKKLVGKAHVFALKREEARLLAEAQKVLGQLVEVKKQVSEAKSQKAQLIGSRKKEILEKLESVRTQLLENEQQLNALQGQIQ